MLGSHHWVYFFLTARALLSVALDAPVFGVNCLAEAYLVSRPLAVFLDGCLFGKEGRDISKFLKADCISRSEGLHLRIAAHTGANVGHLFDDHRSLLSC